MKAKRAPHLLTTLVDCGVQDRGLVFTRHLPRAAAISMARARYQKELAKIQEALDALDNNRVRVVYMDNGSRTNNYRPSEVDVPSQSAAEMLASTA